MHLSHFDFNQSATPLTSLLTLMFSGAESLARWNSPENLLLLVRSLQQSSPSHTARVVSQTARRSNYQHASTSHLRPRPRSPWTPRWSPWQRSLWRPVCKVQVDVYYEMDHYWAGVRSPLDCTRLVRNFISGIYFDVLKCCAKKDQLWWIGWFADDF